MCRRLPLAELNPASRAKQGVALVELALLMPLLVLLFLTGVDMSLFLGNLQIGTAFSRELVNSAYQQCSGEPESEMPPCLERIHAELLEQANHIEPNTELIVSVFCFDSTDNRFELVSRVPEPLPELQPSQIGRGVENSISEEEMDTTGFDASECIAVSEVYVPFSLLFDRVSGVFLHSNGFTYQSAMIPM